LSRNDAEEIARLDRLQHPRDVRLQTFSHQSDGLIEQLPEVPGKQRALAEEGSPASLLRDGKTNLLSRAGRPNPPIPSAPIYPHTVVPKFVGTFA
jgi:hypothetical protein